MSPGARVLEGGDSAESDRPLVQISRFAFRRVREARDVCGDSELGAHQFLYKIISAWFEPYRKRIIAGFLLSAGRMVCRCWMDTKFKAGVTRSFD